MELRRLKYFSRIAAEGSLGAASRVLGIAQPALSRQMQLLESELGVSLFIRVAKGMRLTEEGEYLRDALAHPLQQLSMAFQNVQNFSTRVEATCTLGLTPLVAQRIGSRLVRRLSSDMPNLKLRVHVEDSAKLNAALLAGTVDAAILPGFSPDQRLFHGEILQEQLFLVGARKSRLEGRVSIDVDELGDFDLILPSPPNGVPVLLEMMAARFNFRTHVAIEIDSLEVTKDLVRSGNGYSIMPQFAVESDTSAGSLIALPIVNPNFVQSVHFATQTHWRIPRSVYNQFHRTFYSEWMNAVDEGYWPGVWLYDRDAIHRDVA